MELEDYLEIPMIVTMTAVQSSGDWVRRAAYPELPGCTVEGLSVIDTLERLEILRRERTREMLASGQPVPVPRRSKRASEGAEPLGS